MRERAGDREAAERVERARQVRGLVVLAVVVLVGSLWRAGWGRVFTAGWMGLWGR